MRAADIEEKGTGGRFPITQGGVGGIKPIWGPEEKEKPGLELRGWEKSFALRAPGVDIPVIGELNLYDVTRAVAEVLPYTRYIFPSGRDAFMQRGTGKQTVELMFEALAVAPGSYVGKGTKIAVKKGISVGKTVGGKAFKRLPFSLEAPQVISNPYGDALMREVPKFNYVPARVRLMNKYGLSEAEATAAMEGRSFLWEVTGRSGARVPMETEGLKRVFAKDTLGKILDRPRLRKEVRKEIEAWSKPIAELRHEHYVKEGRKLFMKLGGPDYTPDDLFRAQVKRLYGEAGEGITFRNVDDEMLGNILIDSLKHGKKITRNLDITSFAYWAPVRKVFGSMERTWGAFTRLYQPIGEWFGRSAADEVYSIQTFHKMLASRRIGGQPLLEVQVKKTTKEVKLIENYTKGEWEEAGRLAAMTDSYQGAGATAEEIQALWNVASPKAQGIAKTLQEWYDWMYARYMVDKIPLIFKKAGVTDEGLAAVEDLISRPGGLSDTVMSALAPGANMNYQGKVGATLAALEGIKTEAKRNLSWYGFKSADELKGASKEVQKRLTRLFEELTPRKPGRKIGFPNYLENYTARIPVERGRFDYKYILREGLPVEMHAPFTKLRSLKTSRHDTVTDIAQLIRARARAQAKEINVYPHLEDLAETLKDMPPKLKAFTETYVNRLLGTPAPQDVAVAKLISRATGGEWDAWRVQQVARKLTDLVYLGGIGFKPFSAMRNYFQPFIMVPTDMGGVKDVLWLGRGYKRLLTDPKVSQYIRDIGAIQEYAPDLPFNIKISKYASRRENLRDIGMWMFKGSDRHNRYVSGAAAVEKFEHYLKTYGRNGVIPANKLDDFTKKLNLGSRESWIRKEIQDHLSSGTLQGIEEAKKIYTFDVIADTQYLYGIKDSPLISYRYGSIGRMAAVFQSWWMNYGSAFSKWMTRAEGTSKSGKMFSFMLTGSISYALMASLWGKGTAARSVLFGPFPTGEISIPPVFQPFAQALNTIMHLPEPGASLEDHKRRITATLRSSMIYVPGGIQIQQMVKGAQREGFPGIAKSILKLHTEKPPKIVWR